MAVRDNRIQTTDAIVDAIAASSSPPGVYLCFGISYGEGARTSSSRPPAGDDFFAGLRRLGGCGETGLSRAVAWVLRFGIIIGDGGGALDAMMLPTKLGVAGPLGSGRQWWSWVHRSDAVDAIVFALDNGALSGAINVVAPEPVRQADFQRTLSRALNRPSFMPAPAFALRMVLGTFAQEVLSSKRVMPSVLTEAGFSWKWADLDAAIGEATSG